MQMKLTMLLSLLALIVTATTARGESNTNTYSDGTSAAPVGFVVLGRKDVSVNSYSGLCSGIEQSLRDYGVSSLFGVAQSTNSIPSIVSNLSGRGAQVFFFLAHSMTDAGASLQQYVAAHATASTKGLVLLASFLQRVQRPDVVSCLQKASQQPTVSLQFPLGFLQDGAHDCYGPNIPSFPVPTLTIGGELDGVVRLTRIAEAYYTQVSLGKFLTTHPVVLINGMNHAAILNLSVSSLPPAILANDLKSELSADQAISKVASAVGAFVAAQLGLSDNSKIIALVQATGTYIRPLLTAFVQMEGNWFFTGGDDEHGSSQWAAQAQITMASPINPTANDKQIQLIKTEKNQHEDVYQFSANGYQWNVSNSFHLLSDEEEIPPYYRHRHRPDANTTTNSISSATVTQLRFIEVTLVEVDAGLNGWGIIKEEKLNILTAVPDDGSTFVSSIEIATKLMSRQKLFNLTGQNAPDSLDDGNRCATINQEAYNWGLSNLNPVVLNRFQKYGIPFVMGDDQKPFPEAGPFWIWKYMGYTAVGTNYVTVQAPYAFFSLSANPYGAGNHYCKLLSPARVLEWMWLDSLRPQYSINH